jgi:endonuclease YncB( thermonuclease family)
LSLVLLAPGAAWAAEVLQVRSATLLQVGDRNRSYAVRLACVQVGEAQQQGALELTRQKLPRYSRVNLRPVGSADGQLLARVRILPGGEDLGSALVAAGLALPIANEVRPEGCPATRSS